jgi:hypothetical protein
MLCNRGPIAQPHAVVPLNVIQQALERVDPPGPTDDPRVQADSHHPWAAFGAAPMQPIERVTAVTEELFSRAEVRASLQPAVVIVEAVGYD